MNRYAYCRNNPINYVDPTGHSWLKNIFEEINRWFRQTEHGLEKATNSEWDINVNAQTTINFGSGGTSQYNSSRSIVPQTSAGASRGSQIPVEQLISVIGWENLVSWFNEPDREIQGVLNEIAGLSRNGNIDKAKRLWKELSSRYDMLLIRLGSIQGIPLHPDIIASNISGKFMGIRFDIKEKNIWKIAKTVILGQEVLGGFSKIGRPDQILNTSTSLLILRSSDSLIVNRGLEVIGDFESIEKNYKFYLSGFHGYQCWDGAVEVLNKIYKK